MNNYEDRDPWEMEDRLHSPSGRDWESGNGPGDPLPPKDSEEYWQHIASRRRYPADHPGYRAAMPIRRNPFTKHLRFNANIVSGGLVLVFAFMLGFAYAIRYLGYIFPQVFGFLQGLSPVAAELLETGVSALSLALPCLLITAVLDLPVKVAFPLRRPKARITVAGVFCCLGMSVVGVYLAAYLSALLSNVFGIAPTMPDMSATYGMAETVVYTISVAVVPAIFEELLFRGVVLQSLRRFGDGFALVVSSILFACSHGNLVQGPNAMLVGLVLGYFALRSGSIFTPIIMHFFNNGIAAVINVLVLYLPSRYAQILNFAMMPLYLILGVIGVVMMLLWGNGFVRPRRGVCTLTERQKYTVYFTAPMTLLFLVVTVYITTFYFA